MVKTTPKQSQSKSTNKTTTSNFSKAIIDNLIDNTKGSKPKVVEKPVKLQQEVTDLKNLSQHQQNLVRLLKSDTKVKTSMIDNIVETLDLKSGRVSPNGMKELIKVSMYFKGIAQGIRDSEGYRLNDSLNHQIKDAFKPFVADMTNDIKDGDILLLQKIGTKVETPVLTRKDFKPTLSTERSEKKRIAEENKAKAEKQVFETKAQIWLNTLSIEDFEKAIEKRKIAIRKRIEDTK
jgi:hypothetical protein|tara:strand:- start:33 stop:737 length:705 start_codon:yes stop_codon:yes gene_type:complete